MCVTEQQLVINLRCGKQGWNKPLDISVLVENPVSIGIYLSPNLTVPPDI
jgi:hypothetical protein